MNRAEMYRHIYLQKAWRPLRAEPPRFPVQKSGSSHCRNANCLSVIDRGEPGSLWKRRVGPFRFEDDEENNDFGGILLDNGFTMEERIR